MLPSDLRFDIVLRLLDGRSEQRELVLEGGKPVPPFAVGTRGAWSVSATRVAGDHLMLAFNGSRLFVCTLRGEMALLDGAPLGARWAEAAMPSELRFGGARVSIGRRAGPDDLTQVPDQDMTRIADLAPPAAAPAPAFHRDDAVTSCDDERLQAALRLAFVDDDVTRIADLEVPAAARGTSSEETTTPPAPPLPSTRPINRTVRIVRKEVALPPVPELELALAPARRQEEAPSSASGIMTDNLLAGFGTGEHVPSPLITSLTGDVIDVGDEAQEPPPEPTRALPEAPRSSAPSSMPATLPSDGLIQAALPAFTSPFPVFVARPSSPTMAIATASHAPPPFHGYAPQERSKTPYAFDSLHMAAVAVSGESLRAPSGAPRSSIFSEKLRDLAAGWREASLPKKAIALLLIPALAGSLLMMRPQRATPATANGAPSVAMTADAPPVRGAATLASAAPSSATSATSVPSAAPSSPASSPAAPSTSTPPAPSELPTAGTAGLRDTRTAERRALDTAASGLDASAAEQYAVLAAAHPGHVAFREAARILRARATNRHD